MERVESLAAGVLVDVDPVVAVHAAAAGGWPACGVWFDANTWSAQRQRDLQRAVASTGIHVLDIEPVIVGTVTENPERIVSAAEALGARFVLFTSKSDDWVHVTECFARTCDQAAQIGVTVVCEFLPIYPLATLDRACQIVGDAARPNGAVLLDNLHLRSAGLTPRDVAAYPPALFPYVQVADAPLAAPVGRDALIFEAALGRLWPGEGALPIGEFLRAVPNVAVSYEVRSQAFREAFPDPVERATEARRRVLGWADEACVE